MEAALAGVTDFGIARAKELRSSETYGDALSRGLKAACNAMVGSSWSPYTEAALAGVTDFGVARAKKLLASETDGDALSRGLKAACNALVGSSW